MCTDGTAQKSKEERRQEIKVVYKEGRKLGRRGVVKEGRKGGREEVEMRKKIWMKRSPQGKKGKLKVSKEERTQE